MLLICDEVATGFGRTGTLFASEQAGSGPTCCASARALTAGYLPMSVTVASGRVFDAFLGDDLGERTLYHGHSYGGNALAAAVALRHLELIDAWDVLANVRERSDELARPAARPRRVEARGARGAPARARWAASSSRRPPTACAGAGACRAAAVRAGRAAAPDRRHRGADAAAHDHVGGAAPDRARARRRDRRGLRRTGTAAP